MTMPNVLPAWTVEMLHELPDDGNRYEIVDGELLVSPAPTIVHQRIVQRLGRLLEDFIRATGMPAEEINVDADIVRDRHTLVQPDVLVIDWSRGGDRTQWPPMHSLLLAVEVLSPSTARRDRTTKRALYLSAGVEYWIADPDARIVEQWTPGSHAPLIAHRQLVWRPAVANQSLVIPVAGLFGEPPLSRD